MNCKFRNEVTVNGYDFGVMKSGLQKYIRRGNEEKALRCVEEMDRFAEVGNEGERLRTNMLHRLQIIFLEDISIGNYYLWENMCEWLKILFDERKKMTRDRVKEVKTLELVVRNLCKSKKTRAASFMNSLCSLTAEDVVLLATTGYAELIDETKSLEDCLSEFDELMAQKSWKSILLLKRIFVICVESSKKMVLLEDLMEKYVSLKWCKLWKKDLLKLSEGFCLYFVPLGKYLYGSEELQLDLDCAEFEGIWPKLGPFTIDDYVLDKHVKSKHVKHKGTTYFAIESSMVSPEVFRVPGIMKEIYVWVRCGKDPTKVPQGAPKKKATKLVKLVEITDISLESELEFVTRIQLVTSNGKTDTYYANFAGDLMFVKGPFKSDKIVKDFIRFQEEKKELGMPFIEDIYCLYLVPDRWPEGTPLGLRKSLDLTQKWPFMVSKSLYEMSELVTKQHSSALWPVTEVVDTKMCIDADVFKLSGQYLIDYLTAIAYRLSRNLGDLADRNFMIKGDRLYSIDEEVTAAKVDVFNSFKEKKYKYVKEKYMENKDVLSDWVVDVLDKVFVV
jgi:hypothetical protein